MANIIDYLEWRGDIPFSADIFNEVDGLILSQFCYVLLDGIVPGRSITKRISLREAYRRYDPLSVPVKGRIATFEQDNILFRKLAESARFGNTMLSGYVNFTDAEEEIQFSALSCFLSDGSVFAAFKGTDGTVVGWKEDFNLSYMQQTSGQLNAVNYLNENFNDFSHTIRIGGHSKGGNLAVYASAYCNNNIKEKITNIYSYDGPGFRREIVESPQYRAILPRVMSFVPESSIVGMLLASDMEQRIVKSSAMGISQHIAYTWELKRNRFVIADKLTRSGNVINKTISGWLDEFSDDERQIFVDTLFGILEAPDKPTLREISSPSSYAAIIRAMRSLTPEQQKVMREAMKKIAGNGRKALFSDN